MLQIEVQDNKTEWQKRYSYLNEQKIVVTNRVCKICKNKFYLDYRFSDTVDNNCCRDCQFWVDNYMADFNRNFAIVEGTHYVISSELTVDTLEAGKSLIDIVKSLKTTGNKQWKGMGGAKHIIKFTDGRIVVTDDLWHQGDIPEHMKNYPRFADNAVIVGVA